MVEILMGDFGGAIPRFSVKLRMFSRHRRKETPARRKGESEEGNNPDHS